VSQISISGNLSEDNRKILALVAADPGGIVHVDAGFERPRYYRTTCHLPGNISARAKAVELVGQDKFDISMADPWIGTYLQTTTGIYGQTLQNGMGGIPKLIFGSRWVIPQPNSYDDLVMTLQKSLAVPIP